jgi:hypothetical protein
MQGFVSGDLNSSETSAAISREANKIVDATGAAVVLAAHISKANIGAEKVEQGFASGSLAIENAARQMAGMIGMTEAAAKLYGLEATRHDYVRLEISKNSYGPAGAGMWMRKVFSLKHHTVVIEPVTLTMPLSAARKSANEHLGDRVAAHLGQNSWVTKNMLDGIAGEDGPLKASKAKVRECVKGLLDEGLLYLYEVTESDRSEHGIAKQVTEVLRLKPAGKPAKGSPPTGGHDSVRRASNPHGD